MGARRSNRELTKMVQKIQLDSTVPSAKSTVLDIREDEKEYNLVKLSSFLFNNTECNISINSPSLS